MEPAASFDAPVPPRFKRAWRTYDELTSAEVAQGRAMIADCLAGGDPGPWLPRLGRGDDGTLAVLVRRPQIPADGVNYSERQWLTAEATYVPLAEGMALLQGPDNPEREIEARRRARNDEAERVRLENEASDRRTAEWQADAAARARHREVDLRGKEFDTLPGWVRNDYVLARIFERNSMPQIAAEIRAVADEGRTLAANQRAGRVRRVWMWPGDTAPRKYEPETEAAIEASIGAGPEPCDGWWRR